MKQERPTNFTSEELEELIQVLARLKEEQTQIPSPHGELIRELSLIWQDVLHASRSIINKWHM